MWSGLPNILAGIFLKVVEWRSTTQWLISFDVVSRDEKCKISLIFHQNTTLLGISGKAYIFDKCVRGKGLVTMERFLGRADTTIMCSDALCLYGSTPRNERLLRKKLFLAGCDVRKSLMIIHIRMM